ncbi:MAG: hypothetical protein IT292_04350 [Deltaproteobacteria bacterium]|nr:hypothetical protein [Deltaproteobacteria bacterium]
MSLGLDSLLASPTARARTEALMGENATSSVSWHTEVPNEVIISSNQSQEKFIRSLILQSGLNLPALAVISTALLLGFSGAYLAHFALSIYFLPIVFGLCGMIPFAYLNKLAEKRADEFLADYPSVLLATASSMKAGHTVHLAFERAVMLLPPASLARKEIEILLHKITVGVAKEIAISEFARSIRLPELDLFRSAFLLVSEHGGRFVPTLQRLSMVSRDRSILIGSAKVSTSSMRMTANFLLAVTPLLILMVSLRSADYWELILHHPTANLLASLGATIIIANYVLLRKLSAFKP